MIYDALFMCKLMFVVQINVGSRSGAELFLCKAFLLHYVRYKNAIQIRYC